MDLEDIGEFYKEVIRPKAFEVVVATSILFSVFDNFVLFPNQIKSHYEQTRIEYVNEDSLPDLVSPKVGTFLQKKDGTFQSIDDYLKEKKETEMDSLKNAYEQKAKAVYKRRD